MTMIHILILLTIGYLVFTFDLVQKNLPVPVILVLIGTGLSFVPFFAKIEITGDLIYSIFLPSLLFVSAYHFSVPALKKHIRVISYLSTIGIVLTVALLGFFIYYSGFIFTSSTLLGALLLATILTLTDPVSGESVLHKSLDNPEIANIANGVSMINEGTGVVVFTVLFNMFTKGHSFSPLEFFQSFLFVSLGGITIGLLVGWLLSKAVHLINRQDYHVMLSIVMAYGGFHLAEYFHVSGVLATVTAGLMLSWEFNNTDKAEDYRDRLDAFWGVIEPSLLSLLFLLIGIIATPYLAHPHWIYAFIIFIVSIMIRFLVVSTALKVFLYWEQMSFKQSIIISWAGIRGAVSIYLLLYLSASSSSGSDALISIGYSVVLLSLVFQSIGVYPLSKMLSKEI